MFLIQPCGHQCSRHGTCVVTEKTGFACNCTRGYVGETCEVPLKACELAEYEGKACRNGGICQGSAGPLENKCSCLDGWTGELCEIPVDFTVSFAHFLAN